MSVVGQKQTSGGSKRMSALPPKADIGDAQEHVRFGPTRDVTSALITHGHCAGVGQRARRELAVELVVNHPCDASPVDATVRRSAKKLSERTSSSVNRPDRRYRPRNS
jgi:hypothetical protein